MRQSAVVICPGRGTYTKAELGYLAKHIGRRGPAAAAIEGLVTHLDQNLATLGQPTVTGLDSASTYSLKTHTPGEFASTLIYGCSAADFLAIDQAKYDIVAVTGNSMGWYTALALAGALPENSAFTVIHTMGSMMKDGVIGGQLIYPVVDAAWQPDPERTRLVEAAMQKVRALPGAEVHLSIRFGGYAILGGNSSALSQLMQTLPPVEDGRYPMVLVNHAAFHTPMMAATSGRAFATLPPPLFSAPKLPLIDGRGAIWQPYSTDAARLRDYTLGQQVTEPYDFGTAIEVALKEFAPDKLILLGPGSTSGGAIGQVLVRCGWLGIKNKDDFGARQAKEPFLLAMGRPDQAALVVS